MAVIGKGFTCSLSIKHNDCSLEQLATRVSKALGVYLKQDSTDDFEEFPAYSATVLGLKVALISHPTWAKADYFELEISMPLPSREDLGEYVDMAPFILNLLKRSNELKNHHMYI